MKILVTGSEGFIGKNLIERLKYLDIAEVLAYDKGQDKSLLDRYCGECEFVYHLAGVNRPKEASEFQEGNYGFTLELLSLLKKHNNASPVMLSSSIQAKHDNPYGQSKRDGEELLKQYGKEHNVRTLIYRFPNVFGKWCRPNYNSVVATFCHNIANDQPVQVNGRDTRLCLVYIDDVVDELLAALQGKESRRKDGFCYVKTSYTVTLGEIVDLLHDFRESRNTLMIPDVTEGSFCKKLYSAYLSYLPVESFKYPLKMNVDSRGSFTEIIRTKSSGQFSVNISKPGIEKGNHWHDTKIEKFVVVSGEALIQLRKPDSEEIISFHVSGERIEVVEIPVGYTHTIVNEGKNDLITFMWCNECFHPDKPDTYFLKVNTLRK